MVSFDAGYSRKRLSGQLAWFILWLAVTLFAAWLVPDPHGHGTHQQLGLPPCPSVFIFGRMCPGCGLTTSFTAFVHGDFVSAWHANAFGAIGYPLFTLSAWACLIGFASERRFNTDSIAFQWCLGVFVAAYLVFGVYRILFVSVPSGLESLTNARTR